MFFSVLSMSAAAECQHCVCIMESSLTVCVCVCGLACCSSHPNEGCMRLGPEC